MFVYDFESRKRTAGVKLTARLAKRATDTIVGKGGDACKNVTSLRKDCFAAQRCAYRQSSPSDPLSTSDVAILTHEKGSFLGVLLANRLGENHYLVHDVCVVEKGRGKGVATDMFQTLFFLSPLSTFELTVARPQEGGHPLANRVLRERELPLKRMYERFGFEEMRVTSEYRVFVRRRGAG